MVTWMVPMVTVTTTTPPDDGVDDGVTVSEHGVNWIIVDNIV